MRGSHWAVSFCVWRLGIGQHNNVVNTKAHHYNQDQGTIGHELSSRAQSGLVDEDGADMAEAGRAGLTRRVVVVREGAESGADGGRRCGVVPVSGRGGGGGVRGR